LNKEHEQGTPYRGSARPGEPIGHHGHIPNVNIIEAEGSLGHAGHAPNYRISVAAAAPQIPESFNQQLDVGGKMVLPVGRDRQELLLVKRKDSGFKVEEKMGVIFVPLTGVEGFKEEQI
jgi:protein-L-isoaspartate(D-aspartate) O-methyltransferase